MRSLEQINVIKKNISDPFVIKNFLNTDKILHLINLFSKTEINPVKVYKNTGPITIDIKYFTHDIVIKEIFEKLYNHIGIYDLTAGFFFTTNYPHIIHNDDLHDLPDNVYKGITIPLRINGNSIPKLCFFNQFYFHGPSKFFNGDTDIPTFYNKQVYSYELVDNLNNGPRVSPPRRWWRRSPARGSRWGRHRSWNPRDRRPRRRARPPSPIPRWRPPRPMRRVTRRSCGGWPRCVGMRDPRVREMPA